jgi:hypothetical protein
MRINVYSQELTPEVGLTTKTADTGITYYGIRMILASPDKLHHTPTDDDRSAITFWLPDGESLAKEDLRMIFLKMAHLVKLISIGGEAGGG